MSVTRVCHREVAARRSAGSLEAEGAEGRRFRLETKPITSPRRVRSVGRFAAPHHVGSRVGAGAFGKAGRTRQSQDLAGKRGPEIVRQVSSLLVGGERHAPTSKEGETQPQQPLGRRRRGSIRAPTRFDQHALMGHYWMKSIAPGTEVIRRLLMEETSTLTLPSARGERRASPNDCRVALDGDLPGTSEVARVLMARCKPRADQASSGAGSR